jgi:hypothetical protein
MIFIAAKSDVRGSSLAGGNFDFRARSIDTGIKLRVPIIILDP